MGAPGRQHPARRCRDGQPAGLRRPTAAALHTPRPVRMPSPTATASARTNEGEGRSGPGVNGSGLSAGLAAGEGKGAAAWHRLVHRPRPLQP